MIYALLTGVLIGLLVGWGSLGLTVWLVGRRRLRQLTQAVQDDREKAARAVAEHAAAQAEISRQQWAALQSAQQHAAEYPPQVWASLDELERMLAEHPGDPESVLEHWRRAMGDLAEAALAQRRRYREMQQLNAMVRP